MIITTDDLCLSNLKYFKHWDAIKAEHSKLNLIAFTIANNRYEEDISKSTEFKEWYEERKDWIQIGLHGYDHGSPPEQERDDAEDLVVKSLKILEPFLPEKFLYRPPGFQRTIRTEPMLIELGCAGIAYQTKIKYFRERKIFNGVFNTHCCNEFSNPITKWESFNGFFHNEYRTREGGFDKETGIWGLEAARSHFYDHKLARRIYELYSPSMVADIGCGDGTYCRTFSENGWIIHGYEGTPDISSLGIYNDIRTIDLTKDININMSYDLVLCLEVGEHIPEKHEQIFIDNLCNFCDKDLILSWSLPGGSGLGHVNERPNEYIIYEITKRGFKFDGLMSNDLRSNSTLWWFKGTIMVFKRTTDL